MTEVDTVERPYLLVKRGLFYKPDDCGYVGVKEWAGRYSLEEVATRFPNVDSANQDGIYYIHEDDAPEYSDACYWDVKLQHQLDKAISRAEKAEAALATARADALREAVETCEERADMLDDMGIECECCVGTAKNCAADIEGLSND